jgi:hypothetical protein
MLLAAVEKRVERKRYLDADLMSSEMATAMTGKGDDVHARIFIPVDRDGCNHGHC